MTSQIILLAGPIAVGKTAAAEALSRDGATHIRVRQALADVLGESLEDRKALQVRGAELDRRTSGLWLRDYLLEAIEDASVIIVDSLRTRRQTEPLLSGLTDSRLVYLQAHETTRRRRYEAAGRSDPVKAKTPFDAAMAIRLRSK